MTLAFEFDAPIGPKSTLGVGGSAAVYGHAQSVPEWIRALEEASRRELPLVVLGRGSNVVIADRGLAAVVIKPSNLGWREMQRSGSTVRVRVEAGTDWDGFVAHACQEGWAGIECLSGIPGLVGAAPIQNVGAYGQEVSDVIASVTVLRRSDGRVEEWPAKQCSFAYRDSIFKQEARDHYVVLSVDFDLKVGGPPTLSYAELIRAVDGASPSLSEVRRLVIELRRRKAMVLVADGENSKTAGSFFTNPILPSHEALAITTAWQSRHNEKVPSYSAGEGLTKLAAGWLIERSGLHKGYGEGAVGLSTVHCLAIVNRGGATARQVLGLARHVQERVDETFGVHLQVEPRLLGFTQDDLMLVRT